jgi:large subunit ribosomal protein L15e
MSKSVYSYIRDQWKTPKKNPEMKALLWKRRVEWRKDPVIKRVERPTRLDRARGLGYKAKQGFVIVRTRVRTGGQRRRAIKAGRRPKRKGILKMNLSKSIQSIAEERVNRKYPNLEILNSYFLTKDGRYKFYEIILVDPHHPVIRSDRNINWICGDLKRKRDPHTKEFYTEVGKRNKHTRRVYRGKTSSGKKGRGLRS